MFSRLLFLIVLFEFSRSSSGPLTKEFYEKILTTLDATELNESTMNVLLHKLKLRNCSAGNSRQPYCGKQRCVPQLRIDNLFERHQLNSKKKVGPTDLAKLSTSLLYYLLPEKNAGAKPCHNGDNATSMYNGFLQYYQTNGYICARLLDIILRDLKKEFNDSDDKQNCFSVIDLFKKMNLSIQEDELDSEQFNTINIMILSYMLGGKCVTINNDHLHLPCRSYFTYSLLGPGGRLTFHDFYNVLESLGLGNETDHDAGDENHEPHDDHRRKRREISLTTPSLETSIKQCYSANDLAAIFTVNKSNGIDNKEFREICPAMIQQLKSKSCTKKTLGKEESHHTVANKHAWLYGFVSVLFISMLSLGGVAVIPTMKGMMYKKVVIVLVGLAIGTLTGDALFHLIPHGAGFHASSHGSGDEQSEHEESGDDKAFLWKFLVVASGVYGFFLFETLTHLFFSGNHGHSHNIEHTRKHSPFKRNNSCRKVERHEMRFAATPLTPSPPVHNHDTTQVIFNEASSKTEEVCSKSKDDNHDDNIPNLLTQCSGNPGKKMISSVGWMILIGDTIHNITDGIAIGAAFTQDLGGGLSTSIAVFCHELPHELGDFAMLVSSGMTVKQALLANFLSACSSFIGLVIGVLIGQHTEEGNQWVFALMGGMFLYIALVDMLPELMHSDELGGAGRLQIFLLQNLGILLGFTFMLLLAYFEENLALSW